MLTKNFKREEFACPCCGYDNVSLGLVFGLQDLRDALGKPVIVTSGCRCAQRNAAVGGAKRSEHLRGRAADIRVKGMTARELYAQAEKIPAFHGYGVDDARGFVHVDIREQDARWCYRQGREVAWSDTVLA